MQQISGEHGFVRRPLPRAGGWPGRGAAILHGSLALPDGTVLNGDPFAATGLTPQAEAALHSFRWLDDLAAEGSPAARDLAQRLVLGWLRAHPADSESPPGTGRRLIAFVFHAGIILPGLDRAAAAPFFAALHRDMDRLAAAAQPGQPGQPLEALAGLAIAAMSLRGAEARITPALAALTEAVPPALAAAAQRRNPEALLEIAALIQWAGEIATDTAHPIPPGLRQARLAAAQLLAGLTDGSGGLIRAHGGGAALPATLDALLRNVAPAPASGLTLGFGRLAAGEAVATCDMASPPQTPEAHAAALSLGFAAHGQPLIGSCGTGHPDWTEAARATAAHSTLVLGGLSSSRIEPAGGWLQPGPQMTAEAGPGRLSASHDGWLARHGLIHHRSLTLASDGRTLTGEDRLTRGDGGGEGAGETDPALSVALHFHLHPTVAASADGSGGALLRPRRGPAWRLGHDSAATLGIEPSVWLDPSEPAPRRAQQIVLRGTLGQIGGPLVWRLTEMG